MWLNLSPYPMFHRHWSEAVANDIAFAIATLAGWCLLAEMVIRQRFSIIQLLAATCCIALMLRTYSVALSHNHVVRTLPEPDLGPMMLRFGPIPVVEPLSGSIPNILFAVIVFGFSVFALRLILARLRSN